MQASPSFRFVLLVTAAVTAAALMSPLEASATSARCLGKKATIVGTARADVLKGTPRADVIAGLGGNDTVKGLGGKDRICGGDGRDTLIGGAGGDLLLGGEGNDTLLGQDGYDILFGGEGNDTFNGGENFDLASFFFAPAAVQADLSTGTATGEGADTLTGVEDLEGSRFDDSLTGDAGENFFYPGEGNDTIDGGDGTTDRVYFFGSSSAVTVDLVAGTATGQGSDSLTGIEEVYGSPLDDMITGDAGPNSLFGGPGNDTISGAAGDDKLYGGAGDDSLDGGDGTDALDGGAGTDTCLNGESNTSCEA